MITLSLFLIAGYLLTFLATPIVNRIAMRINLVDQPNSSRKIHHTPIPLTGGITIGISILLMTPIAIGINPNIEPWFITLTGIYLVFLIIGSIDDQLDLPAKSKFVIQIICATIAVKSNIYFPFIDSIMGTISPIWLNQLFNIILIIGTVNAYNLSDGIDGLSGGFLLMGFLTLSYYSYQTGFGFIGIMSAIGTGTLISFLKFNFACKNKIFMGDGGTLSMGFLLVALYILQLGKLNSGNLSLNTSQILLTSTLIIPILDCIIVFLRRINHYQSPFKADKKHLHHIVVSLTHNHKGATLFILFLAIGISLLSGILYETYQTLWILAILPLIYLLVYFILNKITLFKKCKMIITQLENH